MSFLSTFFSTVGQDGLQSVTSHNAAGSRPGSSQDEVPPREPTPVPQCSIYMIAVEFLLEVKATQVKTLLTTFELFQIL